MSTFVQETEAAVKAMPENSQARIALTFLLNNAVGWENAKSAKKIVKAVESISGLDYTKHKFQTQVVRLSRSAAAGFFIGTSRKGFFVIASARDVAVSECWYKHRIAAETVNLSRLGKQAAQNGISREGIDIEIEVLKEEEETE